MGRPKKISDSEILLIAFEVISREGFESFTFEQVSKATKLSPAALVKRFKTKKTSGLFGTESKVGREHAANAFFGAEGSYGAVGNL